MNTLNTLLIDIVNFLFMQIFKFLRIFYEFLHFRPVSVMNLSVIPVPGCLPRVDGGPPEAGGLPYGDRE